MVGTRASSDIKERPVPTQPEKSDRTLAKETGFSHPTVAKARKQAEATGKALPVEKRTGADGKARKRNRKARKQRETERQRKWVAEYKAREALSEAEAERLAADLISTDRGLARALHDFFVRWNDDSILMGAIARQLGITLEEWDALVEDQQARIKAARLAAPEAPYW